MRYGPSHRAAGLAPRLKWSARQHRTQASSDQASSEKGKPVARRGRKAAGQARSTGGLTAGLPKKRGSLGSSQRSEDDSAGHENARASARRPDPATHPLGLLGRMGSRDFSRPRRHAGDRAGAVDHREGAGAVRERRRAGRDPRRGPAGARDRGHAAPVRQLRREQCGLGGLGRVHVRERADVHARGVPGGRPLLGRRVVPVVDGAGAAERAVGGRAEPGDHAGLRG